MNLFIDTETTGLSAYRHVSESNFSDWPRAVEIAWIGTHPQTHQVLTQNCQTIYPKDFSIPYSAQKVHQISTEKARENGIPLPKILSTLYQILPSVTQIIGHHILFDIGILISESKRLAYPTQLWEEKTRICTQKMMQKQFPRKKFWSLTESYQKLFQKSYPKPHSALADTLATMEIFQSLRKF